ncbi:AFR304Wp [Eremothecium gossypii ATCC 10895]|uniref:AFR304Wp n=1 Tax=Eremothecium gossypii (strain ATCC 10895 / CBS 109.51 / FGSC 9923 / NRRL Y-1056) TaxID=284811 RepID=Q753K8_EREGS|nr:AFR304Wp [Eremothecium gossypii ATCC 10895]AAS53675.2 AFR304Wp [Eremothecium gossypii ATCC 10895]
MTKNRRFSAWSHRPSISEALNIQLNIPDSPSGGANAGGAVSERIPTLMRPEAYLGRSYVGSFSNSGSLMSREAGAAGPDSPPLPRFRDQASSYVHNGSHLHRQTAALCDDSRAYDGGPEEEEALVFEGNMILQEGAPPRFGVGPYNLCKVDSNISEVLLNVDEAVDDSDSDQEAGTRLFLSPITTDYIHSYGAINEEQSASETASRAETGPSPLRFWGTRTVRYIPAVILGLLLNILDALSYGMIIFPIAEPIFSHLGPHGLSMFYVSTIISQLVYSGGFSSFGYGTGSEMIEVTPFFHTMALSIKNSLSAEKSDDIITTTIVCYALSTIITGAVFLTLGKLRLGKLVSFFPLHILIGCIGGVAYFLIITGIEVSTRVTKFEYSLAFLRNLFMDPDILAKWLIPALLAVSIILLQRRIHNSMLLPLFYLSAFALFHFIVALIPSLSLDTLRDKGWIFPLTESGGRWYDYLELYNPQRIHWKLVLGEIPTMLALTFFGILHVPINVPALAISCGIDKIDVDKELIAHGYSNIFSGCAGSIQNYLVYTNSVLFIRAGADSRYAGFLLAIATFMTMTAGPWIISIIPVCIVSSLIFLLGYELLKEVLYDSYNRLSNFEYITVVIIILTMGIFDFVLGIIVGVLVACFSFLVESTRAKTISSEFDGKVAKSAVHRDYLQSNFLEKVAEQIYVLKLQNNLFFGTIISIEEKIGNLLEPNGSEYKKIIKYLILDFKHINIDNIDYSAAEGFNRIKRVMEIKRIKLIVSSISECDKIYTIFSKIGLLQDVELFQDLNSALEWCENELLCEYRSLLSRAHRVKVRRRSKDIVPKAQIPLENTPRNAQIMTAAQAVYSGEQQLNKTLSKYKASHPALALLLVALKTYRSGHAYKETKEIRLWKHLCPYFVRKSFSPQTSISDEGDMFFVVESGLLKITYMLPQGSLQEAIASKTCYGNISGPGSLSYSSVVRTETECVLWMIDAPGLQKLQEENLPLYTELLVVYISVIQHRFKELLGHSLING